MKDINWHERLCNKNTLECYEVFTGKLSEVINAHIPVKKLRTKSKCLWCNSKVQKAIKKRNRKRKQYCITKRDCDYVKYKECRNIVVKELKPAKKI